MYQFQATKRKNPLSGYIIMALIALIALLLLLRACAPALATPQIISPLTGEVQAGDIALTGTGSPGSTIQITSNGKALGTTKVGADGKWQFTTNLQEPGNYALIANAMNGAKVVKTSSPLALTIPQPVVLTAPVLDTPVLDGVKAGDTINLSGTGVPNSKVELVQDGKSLGVVDVGADGKWSFLNYTIPSNPEWNLSLNAMDGNGNVQASSEPYKLALPLPAATAFAFTAPDWGKLKPGDKVELTGTGAPGSKVDVLVDGKSVGTTTVGADGKWKFAFTLPSTPNFALNFQVPGADGKPALAGDPIKVALPATATAFAFTAPDWGKLKPGEQVELTGTGTPGSKVDVLVDGKSVGTTTVGADGKWKFPFTLPNTPNFALNFKVPGADGALALAGDPIKVALPAAATAFAFTAPDWGKLKPGDKVELTGTGTPGSKVDVLVDGKSVGTTTVGADGKWKFPFTVPSTPNFALNFQVPGADGALALAGDPIKVALPATATAFAFTAPDWGKLKPGEQVELTGTGTPGSKVDVLVDGKSVGTTTVGADGKWKFAFTVPSTPNFALNFKVPGADGALALAGDPVKVALPAAATAFAFTAPDWGKLKPGEQVELTGTGTPGSKVDVLVDGKSVGTATVGADGKWKFPFTLPSTPNFALNFKVPGADGKPALAGDPIKVSLAVPAKAPVITTSDKFLPSGKSEIAGTADPNAVIEIVVDGKVVGKTTADAKGAWKFVVDLGAGNHQIVAQTPTSGKPLTSPAFATTALAIPTLDKLPAQTAGAVTLSGTGTPGTMVEVFVDGKSVGKVKVGSNGKWSLKTNLTAGTPKITLTALDGNGKTMATSNPTAITVNAAQAGGGGGGCGGRGSQNGGVWTVDGCDTLALISRDTGIPLQDLIENNPQISDPNLIYPGQEIVLPGEGAATAVPTP
jgi:protein involved in polysaccharide export with SLBB domain